MRLDGSPANICSPPGKNGSIGGRHVCLTADTPVATLLQLETRPFSRSNRCTGTRLERLSGLCQHPLVPVAEHSCQDQGARSPSPSDSPSMENPAMVPTCSGTVDRSPPAPTQEGESSNFTNREGVHHASRSPSVGRLAIVRQTGRSEGLSEEALGLLQLLWRSKTMSNYESLFNKWSSWCEKWDRDPVRGPVADIANFLADLFKQGYKYRSLNSYRSAISSVHEQVDGLDVGKRPLITRVLRGAFNEKPPRPRYTAVWDVELVLDMFRSKGPTSSLSLQDLTLKVAMLLVLTRLCRGTDLAALDLNHRSYVPEGVVFKQTNLSKQSRPAHHSEEFFSQNLRMTIGCAPWKR